MDVGRGSGFILYSLREIGFKNLLGIDPYVQNDIRYTNGVEVLKKTIREINESGWELIMFHHSFEHVSEPAETLQSISRLLFRNGICLIRIPVVSSYAWRHYGVQWEQLDAPLHSIKSMEILAEKARLRIYDIAYDSNEFQFWGSEQYTKNIPLLSEKSYFMKS